MATLREYFQLDAKELTVHRELPLIRSDTGEIVVTPIGKLHFAFESRSIYVSIYIPETDRIENPCMYALGNLPKILEMKNDTYVQVKSPGDSAMDVNDLVFSGRIFIYDENETNQSILDEIQSQAAAKGHDVRF